MPKKIVWFFLFVTSISFCSCFEIVEEINLKNNGSGDMTLTFNFSKSKSKVASLLLLDSVSGYKIPSRQEIINNVNEVARFLQKSEGISNVRQTLDMENYIATFNFSFKQASNINNLTANALKKFKIKPIQITSYTYNTETSSFTKTYKPQPAVLKKYNTLKPEVKEVFKTATYTNIFRFEKPVTTYSNKQAKLSKSQKAVKLETSVLGLINGTAIISNTIQLAK